jgi:drug/metabolite transporter (DMT)-like permease
MKTSLKADLALLMITIFWGTSCLLTKIGLGEIGAFNLIALRFIIAFSLSAAVFWKKIRHADRRTVRYAAIISVILFMEYVAMTYGVKMTSVSNAGFLTCLAGVFVPIISFAFLKQKLEIKVLAGICLTFIGIYLLTVNERISFNLGDLLCTLCSIIFAVHIIVLGKLTVKVDSVALGVIQLGFAGIYALAFSYIFEDPILPASPQSWLIVITLSVFCTAIAFIVQTVAQKYTSPVHTGFIFSLEPVFTAIVAFIFVNEVLPLKGYLGGFLMIVSVILVEIDFKTLLSRKNSPAEREQA